MVSVPGERAGEETAGTQTTRSILSAEGAGGTVSARKADQEGFLEEESQF